MPTIHLHINSPGGSVFDGQAIYTAIKRHPADVISYVDGLAASIASVIALAGNTVVMAENALFMIHDPWGSASGTAADMRLTADILDKVKATIVNAYCAKTGKPADEVEAMMTAETWMSAQEAVDEGFADEVSAEIQLAASFDLSRFKNAPQNLGKRNSSEDETKLIEARALLTEVIGDAPDASPLPGCLCTGCPSEDICPMATDCPTCGAVCPCCSCECVCASCPNYVQPDTNPEPDTGSSTPENGAAPGAAGSSAMPGMTSKVHPAPII